jgi:LAGLIDADG endonuclease
MNNNNFNITSDWISGFTQSDGSFVISFINTKSGIPIRPVPVFNLTQSKIEYELFIEIQKKLGIGKIYINRQNVTFVVKSIDEIIEVLLPLFDSHPLRGSKLTGYNIFKTVVLMIKEKKHLTLEGVNQIINLSYFMNKDTSLRTEESKEILVNKLSAPLAPRAREKLGTKVFNIIPNYENSLEVISPSLTLEFVRGLIDGDGSFNVSFATTRRRISVNFTVVCELSSISVLNDLVDYFGCGTVYKLQSKAARYQVQSVNEMLDKVYPKFKGIRFNTKKQNHFEKTIKVAELIKSDGYETNEGLKTIVDLA